MMISQSVVCIYFFRGGGGDFGVFGALHAPTRGSENDTLLPMTMTCDRLKFWSGPVRLGGEKLSSGNLGGGRIKK